MQATRKAVERSFDYAPAVAFVILALFGSIYIATAKLFAVNALFVTLVPVLLMLGYAGMILSFRRLRQRDDQSGDNFYYMGFIFTLVSLGSSLFQFDSVDGVDQIVRNFGIAIATTITGIILRIFFNQLRRDPIEVEQISRQDLAEAARRVRRELSDVSEEMAHYRRTNQQMIDEGFVETKQLVETMSAATKSAIEDLANTAKTSMQSSTAELDQRFSALDFPGQLEGTAKGLEKVNSTLAEASEMIASAAEMLSDKVSAMQTPDRILEVKLQPVVKDLEEVVTKALDRIEAQTGEFASLRSDLNASARQLNSTAETLATAAEVEKPKGRRFWPLRRSRRLRQSQVGDEG